jgi:hypothetical protein
MTLHFHSKPEMVQLTEWGAARVPEGSSWMIFDVDSDAPSCTHPGAWLFMSVTIVMAPTPQDSWAAITRYGR